MNARTAAAFAPRVVAGKPGYEAYFIVLNHAETRRALWLRYTRLATKSGSRREPVAAIWASFFDAAAPQRHVYAAESIGTDIFSSSPSGSTWLAADRMVGNVETRLGTLAWDIELSGECGVFDPLPRWLTRLPIGGTKDIVLEPRMHATGSVTLAGERMNFDGARGAPHHMWGTRLSQEIYYTSVQQFDDDPEGWSLETVSVRPDPFSPLLTWATIGRPGEARSSASLWRMLRGRCRADYPGLELAVRGADFDVKLSARMADRQITAYRFRDPDGKSRFVEQSDVCTIEAGIRRDGRVHRLRTEHGGVVEFHQTHAPWSALVYSDPYGSLFDHRGRS